MPSKFGSKSTLWTLKSETPKGLGWPGVQRNNRCLYLMATLVYFLSPGKVFKKGWSYFLKSKLEFGTKYIIQSEMSKFNHIPKPPKTAIIPLRMALNGQALGVSFNNY